MQKKKIIPVVLLVTVVVIAVVGYEFFVADSLSGYTKVSLTIAQTYSIKFGNTVYYITYDDVLNGIPATMPVFQVTAQTLINNSTQSFGANQGGRPSFAGLQMVVDSVNSNRMILYVKSTVSNSEPIISSVYSPTPYPSTEPSNEVVVSGTVHYCQSGTITFYVFSHSQSSTPISNSKYSILLVGGQSYNVTISYQGPHGEEMQFATVNVPTDVTYFTANF